MDFFQVCTRKARGDEGKEGVLEVYPDFTVGRSKDLMVRGKSFYAIWDGDQNIWSTDEYDVQRFVDKILLEHAAKLEAEGHVCNVKTLRSQDTGRWDKFQKFVKSISDNSHQLDAKVIFANTEVKKTDYATKRLPYSIGPGSIAAYDELISLLYTDGEREKFEWAIGAIISGDSKKIQKFLVFHGKGGTGKSTVMEIIQLLFEGYWTTFDVQDLIGNSNNFALESFKDNPLVAIQHDTDLSRIEDNSRLNSIVSHEAMRINEKFKSQYQTKINAFLFIGTNKPVKISDSKSGLIRRLIDVYPTGNKHRPDKYYRLMDGVKYELGAIAQHCLDVYLRLGRSHYAAYEPTKMMLQTNVFRNFIEENYDVFKTENGTSLRAAYAMYKTYCDDSEIKHKLPMYKFREELRGYFDTFEDRATVGGVIVRSYFSDFNVQPYKTVVDEEEETYALSLEETESILDKEYSTYPAQYGKPDGTPRKFWDDKERLIDGVMKKPRPNQVVDTTLADIDTSKLHFVKVPSNHVVLDFDLTDADGEKSLLLNREAASELPPTYAEISKSGSGVHLHYLYAGDVSELANKYADGIEIKVFTGNSTLRRRLTRCNDMPITTLSSGLPKKENRVLQADIVRNEKTIRAKIDKNLRKEYHPGTKPSIDFIAKILEEAYELGIEYDVSDLKPIIGEFAAKSTNQSLKCLKIVKGMKFKSKAKEQSEAESLTAEQLFPPNKPHEDKTLYFDMEVFPNHTFLCWVDEDSDQVVKMLDPTAAQIEELLRFKLIGFNCRQYDNHIIYARLMGASIEQLYRLSTKIINKDPSAKYGEAYNLSYADIWDYSTDKRGLKKWQIELRLPHKENDLPWDQPVPDDKIKEVFEYCANDVLSTRSVHRHLKQDFMARQILAELSGLKVNDTTPKHMSRLVFGTDSRPQREFVYTDLSEMFPGYVYDFGKSTYRGEEVGEGGYVYAEPGIYDNVTLLDVASMHPTSIVELNLFGKYTSNFAEMMAARLAIKNGNLQAAAELFDGRLSPYLGNKEDLEGLSNALKIAINTVYGLTSASFDNSFRDPRNKDNIVAKRGALFMIDLKHAVQEKGFTVAHIKTDSIKIPNATPEIIEFIRDFGKKYGYTFEHEATYKKFCLVNDAVYIARVGWTQKKGNVDYWSATGAQFKHPYVFKTLFSHEPVTFDDLCETKAVQKGAIYLDFNPEEATPNEPTKNMRFIGKTGLFVPVEQGANAGTLWRIMEGNPKPYAVAGTKGYFWAEADVVKSVNNIDDSFFNVEWASRKDGFTIDMKYFEKLAGEAKKAVGQFGDFEEFVK